MIGGLAVLYPTKVSAINQQPWQNMSNLIKYVPGRIMIMEDSELCIVVLFESGAIRKTEIEDLKMIPEIFIEESKSYIVAENKRYYLKDNYLHREDGPAIERVLGGNKDNKFFLEGVEYTPEEWLDTLPEESQTEMLFHLDKIKN
jgi:hypothetical protein